jgi:HK97 family phage major capsid protein
MVTIKATPGSRRQQQLLMQVRDCKSPLKMARQLVVDVTNEATHFYDEAMLAGAQTLSQEAAVQVEALKSDITFLKAVRTELEEAQEVERHEASLRTQREEVPGWGTMNTSGASDEEPLLARLRLLQRTPFKGRKYEDLFGPPQRTHAFKNFDEFLGVVSLGQFHPGLVHATQQENVPSSGGFLAPTEYSAMLLNKSLEQEVIRPRAQVVPMPSHTKLVGSFQNDDTSGSAPYGGLALTWMDESGEISLKEAKTRQIRLNSKKAGMLVPVSSELLEDGTSFGEQITAALPSSVGWGLDAAFIRGDESGKPLGILNAPSLITCTKRTGQPSATLWHENLVDMYSRMHPACISQSVWLAHPSTAPQLLTLQVGTGASNTWYPALKENSGEFSMLGRPCIFTEKCSALGTVGDLIFVSLAEYLIGLRKDITVDRSAHILYTSDRVMLRALVRLDGQPIWDKVYTPLTGPTLSWAIVLQTR